MHGFMCSSLLPWVEWDHGLLRNCAFTFGEAFTKASKLCTGGGEVRSVR